MTNPPASTGQILLCRSEDGCTRLDVRLENGVDRRFRARSSLTPVSWAKGCGNTLKNQRNVAEEKGFEPLVQFPIRRFSKPREIAPPHGRQPLRNTTKTASFQPLLR